MATVEKVLPRFAADPSSDPAVFNPLDRLRGTIRRYIVIEGLATAALFVAAWFALGLALDFGLFKLLQIDWVMDAHWLARVALVAAALGLITAVLEGKLAAGLFLAGASTLAVLGTVGFWLWTAVAGAPPGGSGAWVSAAPPWFRLASLSVALVPLLAVLGYRLYRRLTTELSYPSLALVLERRFPAELGDRLITAVEMGNVEAMGRFGYSTDMLVATIAEARARVAKVPVNQVFNWRRLWRMGLGAVALGLLVVAVGFASHAVAAGRVEPARAGWKLAHVSGTFLERGAALWDTPWPRRAHVEFVAMPDGELTTSRDDPRVRVAARPFKWVVADRSARAGWRPMLWSDVTPVLVGRPVPEVPVAALLRPDRDDPAPDELNGWFVDDVEARTAALREEAPARQQLRSAVKELQAELARHPAELSTALAVEARVGRMAPLAARPALAKVLREVPPAALRPLLERLPAVTAGAAVVPAGPAGARYRVKSALDDTQAALLAVRGGYALAAAVQHLAPELTAGDRSVAALLVPAVLAAHHTAAVLAADALGRELGAAEGRLGAALEPAAEALAALDATAERPSMERTLRRLALARPDADGNDNPVELHVTLRGRNWQNGKAFKGRHALAKTKDRYEIELRNRSSRAEEQELPGDAVLAVEAEDFQTDARKLRLIPAPALKRLVSAQEEPAYLYHPVPQNADLSALRGKRQRMAEKSLPLTGTRSVLVVPSGTQLTLTAEPSSADDGTVSDSDEIVSAYLVPDPDSGRIPGAVLGPDGKFATVKGPDGNLVTAPVPLAVRDGRWSVTFRDEWDDLPTANQVAVAVLGGAFPRASVDYRLRTPVEFKVTWTNRYGVSATRTVAVQVTADQAPVVDIALDGVRKVGGFYLVTPRANIPLGPDSSVRDDVGLSRFEVLYEYQPEELDITRQLRGHYLLWSYLFPKLGAPPDAAGEVRQGALPVAAFAARNRTLKRNTLEGLDRVLTVPRPDGAEVEAVTQITPADFRAANVGRGETFNLNVRRQFLVNGRTETERVFPIEVRPGEAQPTYLMTVVFQATDNNADHEGGPRTARNPDPIRLRIVSQAELLNEINKEESLLAGKLEEALGRLKAAKEVYESVKRNYGFDDMELVKSRSQTAMGAVDKARDTVANVSREFRRIERECQINDVDQGITDRFTRYCTRLDALLAPEAVDAGGAARPDPRFARVERLMQKAHAPLVAPTPAWGELAWVTDAEQALYALYDELDTIIKDVRKSDTDKELIDNLTKIRDKAALVDAAIRKFARQFEDKARSPNPTIGDVPAVTLKPGEARKVKHKIDWNQYKDEELDVAVTTSDPSLTVPPKLVLNFDTNAFAFEYEVKAGPKAGTFTVTVTPKVGDPVTVTVVVK